MPLPKGTGLMAIEEKVLCFKRVLLEELGVFQGISLDVNRYLPQLTDQANLVYRNRSEVETDPRYKQLIPYVIILNNDKVLRYQRGKGGGEARLHGLYSIGVGGHISEEDRDLFSADDSGYYDGMRREVREEVDVEAVSETAVALINDDSTDVGSVHFGVVHMMHVKNERIVGNRDGIKAPEFTPISTIMKNPDNYESWSRFCIEKFDILMAKAAEIQASKGS